MYEVKPEFRHLTKDEVLEKLHGDDNYSQIAQELVRLLQEIAVECSILARQGKDPGEVLNKKPSCALETLALEMAAEAVKTEAVRDT